MGGEGGDSRSRHGHATMCDNDRVAKGPGPKGSHIHTTTQRQEERFESQFVYDLFGTLWNERILSQCVAAELPFPPPDPGGLVLIRLIRDL